MFHLGDESEDETVFTSEFCAEMQANLRLLLQWREIDQDGYLSSHVREGGYGANAGNSRCGGVSCDDGGVNKSDGDEESEVTRI